MTALGKPTAHAIAHLLRGDPQVRGAAGTRVALQPRHDHVSKVRWQCVRKAARNFAVDGQRFGYRSALVQSDTRIYEEVRFWRAGTTAQTFVIQFTAEECALLRSAAGGPQGSLIVAGACINLHRPQIAVALIRATSALHCAPCRITGESATALLQTVLLATRPTG